MAESTVAETRDLFEPTRVLISGDGEAVSPRRTAVHSDVIFVREDGWTLGAPKRLEAQARALWQGRWIERWYLREDGHWEKTWPLPGDDPRAVHTPGPWTCHVGTMGPFIGNPADQRIAPHYVLNKQGNGAQIVTQPEAWANADVIAAAPDLLNDARQNDAAFTWLAEQMNSLTDNAKHWNVAQIEALAQDLRIGIEHNQRRTRAVIAKAEGRS